MSAFYNENDAYPAAWLRNLIEAGHIASGTVDERSVTEIDPESLKGFTQCHFFAGIGVWSHALRLAGWSDRARVWTGSCPCQPFSAAGRRKGHEDKRHLWPAWFRLIRVRRPDVIFGEQVASKDGLAWFDAVRADLEAEGYRVGAVDLCAAGVGAPHIRQRLFFVGDARGGGRLQAEAIPRCAATLVGLSSAPRAVADDHERGRALEQASRVHDRGQSGHDSDGCGEPCELEESSSAERRAGQRRWDSEIGAGAHAQPSGSGGAGLMGEPERARLEGHTGHERDGDQPGRDGAHADGPVAAAGAHGELEHAAGDGRGKRRAESGGRGAESRRGDGGVADAERDGGRADEPWRGSEGRATDGRSSFWSACDWIPCRDGKARPVEPGTFPLAHGIAARVGKLRAYGNAIVAPAAAEFVRAYMEAR